MTAFTVPFVTDVIYFLPFILSAGIVWRVHLRLGAACLAGAGGLSLRVMLAPPAVLGE